MRFKSRFSPPPPQVDLVPMLTVMMGILAFFVMITMTLGSETLIDVQLPAEQPDNSPAALPADPFIVELLAEGQVQLNGQPTDVETLKGQMTAYLARNPENIVFLLPAQDLPYEQVMQFLGEMRAVGGNRVSLAIEE
ncbi:biopolymer transporter ExbD [Leptolyngbya sp. CCNP1308]|uniref:ExbD/TolR family protein n=1 Tax=Leptolyngbya sp. CCNP1308 TaxID=3110255 RepID=UPI002B20EC75|nr:biopolymer transporter ExbD [Leptolyngbya sp. CCNP1308]MEA5448124.1 biopolymer transporter ExbD [Leptolyngbya sp. CCNP1308]